MTAVQPIVATRWMIQADLESVVDIEKKSFIGPWNKTDFCNSLARKTVIGLVAEVADKVVGFVIFNGSGTRIELLNMAVHPRWRKQGVGRSLVNRVIARSKGDYKLAAAEVRESNLACQLFLKKVGWTCADSYPEFYPDTNEAALVFHHWIK